jgi:hypothetical protein
MGRHGRRCPEPVLFTSLCIAMNGQVTVCTRAMRHSETVWVCTVDATVLKARGETGPRRLRAQIKKWSQ